VTSHSTTCLLRFSSVLKVHIAACPPQGRTIPPPGHTVKWLLRADLPRFTRKLIACYPVRLLPPGTRLPTEGYLPFPCDICIRDNSNARHIRIRVVCSVLFSGCPGAVKRASGALWCR